MHRSRIALASLTGSAAIGLYRRHRGRLRRTDRISGPVTIDRDEFGVPRIAAGTQRDAMVGLGWAMAQDRLWQMDLMRRTALGRLSEVAGEATLESDRFMRLLSIADVSQRLVDAASEDGRTMLEGFADGVNLWVERHWPPVEFRLLRYRPEPWSPRDSLAILRLMGWSLSGFHHNNLIAEQLRSLVGDEWTDAIFWGRAAESQLVVRDSTGMTVTSALTTFRPDVFPHSGGSNAWAVAGTRATGGRPLLASDPHLGYTNPSVWAEASIEAPGLHVSGVMMPGVPAVMIGRTPTFAWGLTAAMVSQSFLYRETLGTDGRMVVTGGTETPVARRVETILVKGREPESMVIRSTARGPLFSDLEPGWSADDVSIYWTGSEVSQDFDALLGLNRARSVSDAVELRSKVTAPTLNMVAADEAGDIASITIGRIADRNQRPGLLDPCNHPPRYIAIEDLPLERNPERGWVACANNRFVDGDYQYSLHGFYEPIFRIRRIGGELDARERHSLADMRALQLDLFSTHAAELTPYLLHLAGDGLPDWARRDLEEWDFVTTVDSRATLLFQSVYREWVIASLSHALPSFAVERLVSLYGVGDVPMGFCDRLLKGEFPGWIDDDTRRMLVRNSFQDALVWIQGRLGGDHTRWTWGAVHTVTFEHPIGQIPGKHQRFVNIGPFPMPGDRTTVWPSGGDWDAPFTISGGPSMRFVTDLRRPEMSWMTNTLGQTGLPFSRHYRDQVADFLAGRLHPIWNPPRTRDVTLTPEGCSRGRVYSEAEAVTVVPLNGDG